MRNENRETCTTARKQGSEMGLNLGWICAKFKIHWWEDYEIMNYRLTGKVQRVCRLCGKVKEVYKNGFEENQEHRNEHKDEREFRHSDGVS